MSQALRKLAGTLNRTDTICIFTNQLREKIGVMFGNPETTPGGRALKFYSSVRLDIRRIETLKDGAEAFGNRVRVKVVKNKVAPPFKQAEFDIVYGSGIPWEGTVLDVALEKKVVQKAGSYFSFGDDRLGQGRQNATAFLSENPDLVQQILARIQAEAPDDQVISARLLPSQPHAEEAVRSRSRSVEARPCRRGATVGRAELRSASGPTKRWTARSERSASRSDPTEIDSHLEARGYLGRASATRALEALAGPGSVDDERFAQSRAASLASAARGTRSFRARLAERASRRRSSTALVATLESEPTRARRIVATRGASAKTVRYLYGKGFSEDVVEARRCRRRRPRALG